MTDCNKIQANNLACNKISLTDKWKKGELPEGVYYILYYKNDTAEVDIYRRVYSLYDESEVRFTIPQVTEVLAPVPSYEEWKRILHYACKYEYEYTSCAMDYENLKEENTKLKEELKDYEYQHKQDGICYDDIFCKLELARKENRHLKTDCKTLAQKLLQVKPELREWLEVNFKEYL